MRTEPKELNLTVKDLTGVFYSKSQRVKVKNENGQMSMLVLGNGNYALFVGKPNGSDESKLSAFTSWHLGDKEKTKLTVKRDHGAILLETGLDPFADEGVSICFSPTDRGLRFACEVFEGNAHNGRGSRLYGGLDGTLKDIEKLLDSVGLTVN